MVDAVKQQCCTCMVTKEWTEQVKLLLDKLEQGCKDIDLIEQERLLLDKLLRKNRNQHRSTRFFKKLEHVQRLLRKLWLLRDNMHIVADHIAHIDIEKNPQINISSGIVSVLRNACRSVSSLHERRVPSVEWGMVILRTLIDQINMAERLIKACYEAAVQCSAQLAHSFFMPLSMACLAVVSRLQILFVSFLQQICKDYTTFAEISQILPEGGQMMDPWELPEHVFCSVLHGKIPMVKMDGTLVGLLTGKDMLGLYRIDRMKEGQRIDDCCLVVEDHGQPVSREEICAAMHDANHPVGHEMLPAFDTSNALVLESDRKLESVGYKKNDVGMDAPGSMESQEGPGCKVRITESVPVLEKRTTAFIRVGETLPRPQPKKVKKKPVPEPVKSWEDWITSPSRAAQDNFQKKKKRRR